MMGKARPTNRRAAAFLILVVLMLLVIVGATRSLVRGAWTTQRAEIEKERSRTLINAIEAVRESPVLEEMRARRIGTMELPIDDSKGEAIEITYQTETPRLVAKWVKGGRVIGEASQAIVIDTENSQ